MPAAPPVPSRAPGTFRPVEVADAIRTRRTVKAYHPRPVARDVLVDLFELARWAPNHNLTEPWRFRVLGPEALRAPGRAWARPPPPPRP